MRQTPLHRAGFVVWLKSKGPDQEVGAPATPCECPIARFLLDTTGETWVVHEEGIKSDRWFAEGMRATSQFRPEFEYATPGWVGAFIGWYDSHYHRTVPGAAACLAYLAKQERKPPFPVSAWSLFPQSNNA